MIRFITWAFSKLLGLFCFLLVAGGTVLGFFFGSYAVHDILIKMGVEKIPNDTVCGIIGAVGCLIISMLFVIIVFGYMAQVIAINKKVSNIEKLLDK